MALLPQQAGNTAYNIFKHSTVVAMLDIMRQRSPWTFMTPYAAQPRLVGKEHPKLANRFQGEDVWHPIYRNGYKRLRQYVLKNLETIKGPSPYLFVPDPVMKAQEWGINTPAVSWLRALFHYNELRDKDLPIRNAHENWSVKDFSSDWFVEKLKKYDNPEYLRFPMAMDLARMYMRPTDCAVVWEPDIKGFKLLKARVGHEKNFSVFDRDMYHDPEWYMKWKESNTVSGLCVIDFPIHYLQRADMMSKHMDLIRFIQGHCPLYTILITYPILGGQSMQPWIDKIGSEGRAGRVYRSEVYYRELQIGVGAALVNPPAWGGPILSTAANHLGQIMGWGYKRPLIKKANFPPIPRPRQPLPDRKVLAVNWVSFDEEDPDIEQKIEKSELEIFLRANMEKQLQRNARIELRKKEIEKSERSRKEERVS